MRRRTSYFSGRVQGVGFRYTAHSVASRFNLRGFVRNLPDGRVQLVMEGDEREMEQVISEITEHMDSFIEQRTDELSPATGEFEDFAIRH